MTDDFVPLDRPKRTGKPGDALRLPYSTPGRGGARREPRAAARPHSLLLQLAGRSLAAGERLDLPLSPWVCLPAI